MSKNSAAYQKGYKYLDHKKEDVYAEENVQVCNVKVLQKIQSENNSKKYNVVGYM